MKGKPLAVLLIIAAGAVAGVLLIAWLQNRGVVARVNGTPIKEHRLEGVLDKFKPDEGWKGISQGEIQRLKKEILSLLIDEELLLQEARKLGIEVLEEDLEAEGGEGPSGGETAGDTVERDLLRWRRETEKRLLIEKLIAREVNRKVELTEAEVREYYRAHGEEFTLYPMVKVYHIFLKEEKQAQELREGLARGQDFQELARQWSQSPEAGRGGDLGYVRKGDLPEVMEKQIFKMAPGEVSPVVKSSYGHHIFKVTEVIESGRDDFRAFQNKIERLLRRRKQRKLLQSWLQELRGKARITIYQKRL